MEDSYIATFYTVASITKVIESNILIIMGQAFILVSFSLRASSGTAEIRFVTSQHLVSGIWACTTC